MTPMNDINIPVFESLELSQKTVSVESEEATVPVCVFNCL